MFGEPVFDENMQPLEGFEDVDIDFCEVPGDRVAVSVPRNDLLLLGARVVEIRKRMTLTDIASDGGDELPFYLLPNFESSGEFYIAN